jgi:hypothetical protein
MMRLPELHAMWQVIVSLSRADRGSLHINDSAAVWLGTGIWQGGATLLWVKGGNEVQA